jgi:hypothetical protein
MAINSKLKILALAALFFCGLSVLPAQTTYYLDMESGKPRFTHHLTWSGGTNSLHCEVIIEKEEGGRYVSHYREFTTGNFLDISLQPGNYRFRVIPYDILGKPNTGTEWAEIKVVAAVKPELYQPEEKNDYITEKKESVFVFDGDNIEPDAQIYFVNSEGERIFPVEVIRSGDGGSVSLVFDRGQLSDGEYEVFVVNPGGLETSLSGINFEAPRERLLEFLYIIGVSLMPIYPAYGGGFGDGWTLLNISARLGLISSMFLNNYIGMEFSFIKYHDGAPNAPNGIFVGTNLLLVNWMPGQKAAFNFRGGFGFTVQSENNVYSNVGISFLFRIVKHLNVESGVNYIHSLNEVGGGGIQPWFGVSLIF